VSSVIEYLNDDELFLRQIFDCLAPGGLALVSFPNGRSVYRKLERAASNRGLTLGTSYLRLQQRQYLEKDARSLAQRVGFRDGRVRYLTLPLQRLLPRIEARPEWLAPLFLLELHRPSNPG
jgi:SAM-dependent methyltransferase